MENEAKLEERLVAEMGWLQALARSLIRDPGTADDTVQDILLAGVEGRSAMRAGSLRGDLFSKLKTRAFNKRRETARRTRRERDYAREREERAQSQEIARIAAESDTAERLMREVMALSETHRGILLLCYFEGRPHGEVAAALGITDEAVRTRLRRARAALRTRLDASSGGGREAWLPAVCALAGRPPAAEGSAGLSAWTTVLGWSGLKGLVCAAVAVLIGALTWQLSSDQSPIASTVDREPDRMPLELSDAADLPTVRGTEAPKRLAMTAPSGADPAPSSQWPHSLLPKGQEQVIIGRVVERVGGLPDTPVEGAVVRALSMLALDGLARDPDYLVPGDVTDAEGTFEIKLPSYCYGALEVTSPGMQRVVIKFDGFWPEGVPVEEDYLTQNLPEDIVLVPGSSIHGRVESQDGQPIAGVNIHAYWPGGLALDNFDRGAIARLVPPIGQTGADGSFQVIHDIGSAGQLLFRHPDFLPRLVMPETSSGPTVVTLGKGASIHGRVAHLRSEQEGDELGTMSPLVVIAVKPDAAADTSDYSGPFGRVRADGSFSIGGLAEGMPYVVQAWSGSIPSRISEPRSVKVRAVAGGDSVTLPIRVGIELSFSVVDSAGVPMGEEAEDELWVSVACSEDDGFYSAGRFRTPLFSGHLIDGKVRLSRLVPATEDGLIGIQIHEYQKKEFTQWFGPFEDGTKTDLGVITLEDEAPTARWPSVSATVKAVDSNGRALRGATIEHFSNRIHWAPSRPLPIEPTDDEVRECYRARRVQTNASGTALAEHLYEGLHLFRVGVHAAFHVKEPAGPTTEAAESAGIPWKAVIAREGKATPPQVTIAETPTAPLRGSVTIAGLSMEGGAVAFAEPGDKKSLDAARHAVRLGANGNARGRCLLLTGHGEFSVDRAPAGQWILLVAAPGDKVVFERSVELKLPEAHVDLTLERSVVRGVVTSENGKPVEGALVTYWDRKLSLTRTLSKRIDDLDKFGSLRHPGLRRRGSVLSGADGSYALPVADWSPEWSLIVEHDDYATATTVRMNGVSTGQILVPPVELVACGEIQVNPAGRCDIWHLVVDQVAAKGAPQGDPWSVHLDSNREGFTLYRVPEGRVRVRAVVDHELALDLGEVSVEAGRRTMIKIDADASPVPMTGSRD